MVQKSEATELLPISFWQHFDQQLFEKVITTELTFNRMFIFTGVIKQRQNGSVNQPESSTEGVDGHLQVQ